MGNKNSYNHVLPSKSNHKVTLYPRDITCKSGRKLGVHHCKAEGTNEGQLLTRLPSNKG